VFELERSEYAIEVERLRYLLRSVSGELELLPSAVNAERLSGGDLLAVSGKTDENEVAYDFALN
jgi:hypothetical protein